MNQKPRLLFLQVKINPPGGGQSVAAWGLEALKADYEITLLTWKPPQWDEINRYYGTQLQPSQFRTMQIPAWVRRLAALDPDPYSILPLAILIRAARWSAHRADLAVSFNDECDVGVHAIQYIHYPWLTRYYRDKRTFTAAPRGERLKYLVECHYRPWRLLSGFDFERMRHNVTLVNSDWTGNAFQTNYGMPTQTVYPPVLRRPFPIAWQARENGFVCIGRISPEKKYERIIAILQAVRQRGHDVHLHVVGGMNENERGANYYYEIRALIEQHAEWVSFLKTLRGRI